MCQCCAPIGKKLAILFTLSRLAFIILGIVAIVTESELGMEKSEQQGEEENSIFAGFLVVGVWSFFSLWSTFCCVKEEEKECCHSYDDSCCCACTCFSAEFCILAGNGNNDDCNIITLTIMLFVCFFRFYIWILIKCCGKRSRYCIQIFSILCDLEYFVLIIVYSTNMPAFFIILEILLFLSGLSTIIIMIYINYNYKKESEEIEPLQNPLSKEKIDTEEIEMGNGNEIDNENVYNVTPAYQ